MTTRRRQRDGMEDHNRINVGKGTRLQERGVSTVSLHERLAAKVNNDDDEQLCSVLLAGKIMRVNNG